MNSDLNSFVEHCQQRIQHQLKAELERLPDHARNLRAAMQYACLQGGKRVRPLLCYASAEACGGSRESADAAAMAVELIHCYSLIHDDLPAMDDDDLRRGKPTVHRAFDEATAILAGDALQSMAFRLISTRDSAAVADHQRLQMLRLLSLAAGYEGMVGGQAIDFAAMGQQLQLEQLELMHQLKTGALITASVQLGALSAGHVNEARLQALQAYAACIGLAFQVQDDILDVDGDTATLGKTQGADQALNKPTYVALLGLQGARDKALELRNQAIEALLGFGEDADTLRQIADYIIARRN